MCNKRNSKIVCKDIKEFNFRVDGCLANLIWMLNNRGVFTRGSCCGHGRYPMTIVYQSPNGKFWDIMSGVEIPRKKRFYIKDKQGYYFIPETIQSNERICKCGHKEWDEHKCTFEPMVAQECNVKGCKCKKFIPEIIKSKRKKNK